MSSLLPMRAVPFRAVFVLGLGEGEFPAREREDPLDLRRARRVPGDVSPAERDRYLFLEALLSARELVDAATERGAARTKATDETERIELARGLGVENPDRPPKWARPEFKRLKEAQDKRRRRATIDELDRDLQDLLAF